MQKYEQCVLAPRESKEVSTSDYLAAMRKRQLVKITIVSHCRDRRRECPALQYNAAVILCKQGSESDVS